MRFLIITDVEGVAGVETPEQTRSAHPEKKEQSMRQLSREVNACAAGILDADASAEVHAWDGHGSGAIHQETLAKTVHYIGRGQRPPYWNLSGYDGVLFVGQHAMAGTIGAPLCHTHSGRTVAYYKLNEVYIGEFGGRCVVAGLQGVPVIFLSGDDKACLEARKFIPEIETAAVKFGQGRYSAIHRSSAEACDEIRAGARQAVQRMAEIPPFVAIQPPFRFELRHYQPIDVQEFTRKNGKLLDKHTILIETDDIATLPL